MKKYFLLKLFILLMGFTTVNGQPINNKDLSGYYWSYLQLKWLHISSTGFTDDKFSLDENGNILYEANSYRMSESDKQKVHLVKATGHYELDSKNSLIYVCFNKFVYSDSSKIDASIKTVGKIEVYQRHPPSLWEDSSINLTGKWVNLTTKWVLKFPMCDYYIPDDPKHAFSTRIISDADFDKIKLINWDMDKKEILNEIEKSKHIELLH